MSSLVLLFVLSLNTKTVGRLFNESNLRYITLPPTYEPTHLPTLEPTTPTMEPTNHPTGPTMEPTPPTYSPTDLPTPPTNAPTNAPTASPSPPTEAPTQSPSSDPTPAPTATLCALGVNYFVPVWNEEMDLLRIFIFENFGDFARFRWNLGRFSKINKILLVPKVDASVFGEFSKVRGPSELSNFPQILKDVVKITRNH